MERNFINGDILNIFNSNTGSLIEQYVFDKKLGWLKK